MSPIIKDGSVYVRLKRKENRKRDSDLPLNESCCIFSRIALFLFLSLARASFTRYSKPKRERERERDTHHESPGYHCRMRKKKEEIDTSNTQPMRNLVCVVQI